MISKLNSLRVKKQNWNPQNERRKTLLKTSLKMCFCAYM